MNVTVLVTVVALSRLGPELLNLNPTMVYLYVKWKRTVKEQQNSIIKTT